MFWNVFGINPPPLLLAEWQDKMVGVVQLVRTSDCGSEGRGFEPHLPPVKLRIPAYVGIFLCDQLSELLEDGARSLSRYASGSPIFHPEKLQVADIQELGVSFFSPAPKIGAVCARFELKHLRPLEDMYPFKKARLNDCDGNLSARWYIEFYAWDVQSKNSFAKGFTKLTIIAAKRNAGLMQTALFNNSIPC